MATTITNLFPNPSFEVDLAGWNVAGGGITTRTRVTTEAVSGSYAIRNETDGSVGRQGITAAVGSVAGVPSTSYWYAAYVLAPAGVDMEIGWDTYNGGAFVTGGQSAFTGTGEWQRVVRSAATSSVTITHLRPFVRTGLTPTATTFYVDAVMIIVGTEPVDYFDGDSPNAVWTGTPHNSPSVLTIPDSAPRIYPVLKIGQPHIGPMRVGRR